MEKEEANQMDVDVDEEEKKPDKKEEAEDEDLPDELLNEKLETIMSKLAELNIEKEIGEKAKNRDTRVIIESIELSNFKSYADKKYIGPLHYRFNAVVGPNGSGKSNLMESLLFVFGKRAKKMRLNKLNELIHTSTLRMGCRTGKVTINFREIKEDDDTTFHYLPGGDFTLSREVFKNSSSKYTLNGKDISFDELAAILNKKGIDLKHNRFLILQGEVEQIALMKPKATHPNDSGLLEFLEDIIGTTRYVPLIEKLDKSIDELSDIKASKANRVKMARTELDKLENVKNSSTDYYQSEKELLILRHLDHSIKKTIEDRAIEKKRKAQSDAANARTNAENQIKAKIEQNSSILEEHQHIRSEQEVLKQKYKGLSKIAEDYDDEDKEQRNDIETNMKNIKKADQALEKLNKAYQNHNETVSNAQEETPKMIKELEQIRKVYAGIDDEMTKREKDISDKTELLNKKRKDMESKLQPIESEIKANKFQMEQNVETIRLLSEKVAKANSDVSQAEVKEKSVEAVVTEKREALRKVEAMKAEIEANKLSQEKKVEERTKQADAKYKEIQNLLTRLSEIKSATNDKGGKGRMLQSLLKAQQEGKLTGILGRLGDLGSIEEKYDCAITTSCGYLDSIVVETVNDASKALTHLKQNKLGKATFLILDKIKWVEQNMKSQFNLPEGCQRLFDLVKYNNPKLQPAFYFALRDTLVTDNIDTAMAVAFGTIRHRVVTLIGEVIEVYGTVRGGGKSRVGGMGSVVKEYQLNPEEEFERTNKEYEKAVKEYEVMRIELNGLEVAFAKSGVSLQEMTVSKTRMTNDLKTIEIDKADISQALSDLRVELTKLNKEKVKIEELTKENVKLVKVINALENSTAASRRELDAVNNEITAIMGEDYNEKKEEWKTLKKKITQLEKDIHHNENTLKNANVTFDKLKQEITAKEKSKVDYHANIEKCKKVLIDLETKALGVFGEMEKCDKAISDLETNFCSKNKEADELKEAIAKMKEDVEKYTQEIADIEEEVKELSKKQQAECEEIRKNKRSYDKLIGEFGFIDEFEEEISRIKRAKPSKAKDAKMEKIIEASKEEEENNEVKRMPGKKARQGRETIYSKYYLEKELREVYTKEEMDELIPIFKDLDYDMTMHQAIVNDMKPNMGAILQYKESLIQLKDKEEDLNKTTAKLKQANEIFYDVKSRRYNEFMDGYNTINAKLKEMYQLITNGGDAELELVDTLDPFCEGVAFSVRPPKKSWKVITNLSGGEKTLSSLSLIFALHHYKPSPLYVLDEIDAALDFRNVSIIANYIKEQTKDSQFIIISLRNHMFDLANKLIGIYKTMDITKCITFNPESFDLLEDKSQNAPKTEHK